MNHPLRIGITGGIGSGKSTACEIFAKLGVPIIDADDISREVVEPSTPGLEQLVNEFGNMILTDSGQLDRARLRELIFNNNELREKLNSILHPMIYDEIGKRTKNIQHPYCLLSIPLLIETDGHDYVDRILLVDVSEEKQLERAANRDKTNKNEIQKIIDSQTSRAIRQKLADDIINNDGDLETLTNRIEELNKYYLSLSRSES